MVISCAATLCYNFFFLPPVGTLTIQDPQNWLALMAFLATAIVGSRLSERARDEAADARTRQHELEVLYTLGRELLQSENVATLLNTLPLATLRASHASFAVLYLLDGDRIYRSGKPNELPPDLTTLRQLALTLPSADCSAEAEAQVPIRAGVRPRGLLILRGVRFSRETLEAIAGLVSVSIDRTQALEEVARVQAAKESERLRTLMMDSIAHELKTPLTGIKGSVTTLLSSNSITEEDRRELLTVINEEVDRLNHLVTQAVEMAQLDAQEVHMTFRPERLTDLIDDAIEASAGTLDGHRVEIKLPPELPPVRADRSFIAKVLSNLLENAAKYSGPGSPIFVSAEQRSGVVAISVADRGIGIDAAEQPLIFDRFYRVRSQSHYTSGTGMGLSISRAILEAHHGDITVTSQPGQGSVFTFTLPIAEK